MIAVLTARKQELEKELQELIQDFFAENDNPPESVSVEMKLFEAEQVASIYILVKDSNNGDP